MTISELNNQIKKVVESILLKDDSFNARMIADDLINFSRYLDTQDGDQQYTILFHEKSFRVIVKGLLPSAPIGFQNYYNMSFTDDERDRLSDLQHTLYKIYDEIW